MVKRSDAGISVFVGEGMSVTVGDATLVGVGCAVDGESTVVGVTLSGGVGVLVGVTEVVNLSAKLTVLSPEEMVVRAGLLDTAWYPVGTESVNSYAPGVLSAIR